jgi:hypothetical protein
MEPDPALTVIVAKYRALLAAARAYRRLSREVAELSAALTPAQQQVYIAVCERIDAEGRQPPGGGA